MRPYLLIFLLTAPFLLLTSCGRRTSEKASNDNTDTTSSPSNRPYLPVTYTRVTDLEQYYNYEFLGGGVIDPLDNNEFNISQIRRDKRNIILLERGKTNGTEVSF